MNQVSNQPGTRISSESQRGTGLSNHQVLWWIIRIWPLVPVVIIALLPFCAFFAELLTSYDHEKDDLTSAISRRCGRKAAVRNTYSALIHSAETSSPA